MEVEYKREMNRNYMVIRPEIEEHDNYTVRMLNGNQIQGLLRFQDKRINGDVWYYYDITSKQPLSRMLEHRTITGTELNTLIAELLYTLKRMERFLLDEGQLCLQPEYLYIDPDSFKGSLCLIPGSHREFAAEFCELSQYLLDHVNQNDGEAVILAFSVFRECRKLNFSIEDIERCLRIGTVENRARGSKEPEKSIEPPNFEKTLEKRVEETAEKEMDIEEYDVEYTGKVMEQMEMTTVGHRWIIGGIGGVMALTPTALYFFIGIHGIYHWRWGILAGELLAGMLMLAIVKMSSKGKNIESPDQEVEEEPWEIIFREDDIEEPMNDQKEMQTALLCPSKPLQRECRKLVSRNGGPDIPLGYFPFIIGKNKGFVDFCLNQPEVSRLHVKIEESEDGYTVTDLNSTNGTMVNGTNLAANETVRIQIGDELTIASEVYTFC